MDGAADQFGRKNEKNTFSQRQAKKDRRQVHGWGQIKWEHKRGYFLEKDPAEVAIYEEARNKMCAAVHRTNQETVRKNFPSSKPFSVKLTSNYKSLGKWWAESKRSYAYLDTDDNTRLIISIALPAFLYLFHFPEQRSLFIRIADFYLEHLPVMEGDETSEAFQNWMEETLESDDTRGTESNPYKFMISGWLVTWEELKGKLEIKCEEVTQDEIRATLNGLESEQSKLDRARERKRG